MTYVMADIHGEFDKYNEMLEKINFSDDDTLYILGDVLDRGPEPVKLLCDMSMRANVFPILGNHEIMAITVLEKLLVEIDDQNCETHIDASFIKQLLDYQNNGGDITLKQFKELPLEDRLDLLEYLKEFEPYDIIDIGDKTFVLSHTGNIDNNKSLEEHSLEDLTFARTDYEKQVFNDPNIYIVCGHTPTLAITEQPKILHKNNYINIDCGATFQGRLACLCLENLEEFYI